MFLDTICPDYPSLHPHHQKLIFGLCRTFQSFQSLHRLYDNGRLNLQCRRGLLPYRVILVFQKSLRGGFLTIQVKWLPHGPLYRTSPGIRTQPPIVVVLLQSVPLMRSVQFFESSKSVVTHNPPYWPFQIGSHGKPTKSFPHPNFPLLGFISLKREAWLTEDF